MAQAETHYTMSGEAPDLLSGQPISALLATPVFSLHATLIPKSLYHVPLVKVFQHKNIYTYIHTGPVFAHGTTGAKRTVGALLPVHKKLP
jgi:hypothetical protein